ncbi:beta-propeller fold lactonase family protein [uncultured Anaerotruncus sp.]|uniref:beta-propeller fold lactonase family protein n=1 Tax=uncultured Anaerotruncus sp. TaxID=905011 RepID=UPI00280AD1BC|nr:beta-propeller fold lactonase family protein [uncultured Anaerotruncus sp.]
MGILTGYLGTYDSPRSRGVFRFSFDEETGALTAPELLFEAPDAKYLALREGLLAAPVWRGSRAGLCLADLRSPGGPCTVEYLCETAPGCYTAFDGNRVYSANFHEGTVTVYRLEADAPLLEERIEISPGAGCHQVLARGALLLVPCMNLDEIRLFDRESLAPAGSIPFPKGSGPRHGAFDRAGERLFVAAQGDNRLYSFAAGPEGFFPAGSEPLLPPGAREGSEAAAVRLSNDERFLYVSVRGENVVAVLEAGGTHARVIQRAPCGGDHPRDILLSPDGRFLLVANRNAGGLVSFAVDRETGRIGRECARVDAREGVAVVLDAPQKEAQAAPEAAGKDG